MHLNCKLIFTLFSNIFPIRSSKSQMTRNAKIQRLFDIGYPERVHKLIVVNLSPLFDIGYKLFRPFIPEATREKIVVTKNTGELLNYVDADQLPVVYGGTLGVCSFF